VTSVPSQTRSFGGLGNGFLLRSYCWPRLFTAGSTCLGHCKKRPETWQQKRAGAVPRVATAAIPHPIELVMKRRIGQSTISDLKAFGAQVGIPGATEHFVTISSTRFDPTDPKLKAWDDRIKKLFPNDELSPFNFYGLGSALVLVEVLKRSGPQPTRTKFLEELGKLKDFKSEAYFGPITCNAPTNHQCNQNPGWFAWKDDKLVEIQ
jgi:hypothetical protein